MVSQNASFVQEYLDEFEFIIELLVPFSASNEKETLFFRDIPVEESNCIEMFGYGSDDISASQIELRYSVPYERLLNGMQYVEGNVSDNNGDSLLLESAFWLESGVKSKCYPDVIVEEVRVWIENYAMIIWSCKDLNNGSDHEEAVIILSAYTIAMYDDNLTMLPTLRKEATTKYLLNTSLHEAIEIERNKVPPDSCPFKREFISRFPCAADKKIYWHTIFVAIFVSIVIIALAISLWWN